MGYKYIFFLHIENIILWCTQKKNYQDKKDENKNLANLENLNKITVQDIVSHGSIDRLNPILTTAISSAFALVPLVIQESKAGNEIQSPLGVFILCGLLTSTFLNIYIVPIVYEMIQKRKMQYANKTISRHAGVVLQTMNERLLKIVSF